MFRTVLYCNIEVSIVEAKLLYSTSYQSDDACDAELRDSHRLSTIPALLSKFQCDAQCSKLGAIIVIIYTIRSPSST